MNRRILVLDDEPGILDAYRIILSPSAQAMAIASSRRPRGLARTTPLPEPATQAFEVSAATSGEQALAKVEEGLRGGAPFAGGFFDVKLRGGMDGVETIRRVKDIDPGFLCVMVTAYQDRGIDEITKIFGEEFADRWDFLTKPFSHNEILQKARNLTSSWDRRKREKQYLEQIERQQQMLIRQERLAAMGTLARGIGHEFGNILLRIIGKAEIARRNNQPAEMGEALKVIATSAERAGVIVRNLQGIVKMETTRELGDLRIPIDESVQLIDYELKKANIKLTQSHDADLPKLRINRVEIGQVFLNLFINAIHAMEPAGGELRVTSAARDQGVAVTVADTGCGIAQENLERIFEPLFTTKGERGTGIGLCVSRKIAQNHNGRLTVESRAGHGAQFTLWLPLQSRNDGSQ